jgi:hypothetical protein
MAQTLPWPFTRIVASVSMRWPLVSGRPSSLTMPGVRTPAVQQTSRVGRRSPVDSTTLRSSIRSSVVPVRISMPRRRSSRAATSARLAGISRMMRSWASTSTQRVPAMRQRGYSSMMSFT